MALAVDGESDGVSNGGDGRQPTSAGDEGVKTARLPRWTREEIMVLIQGKRVAESRVRRGRTAGLEFGSGQVEPKWASISSYCKSRGVNRGPVQCRKRWSNLAGDFKKIKEYELSIKDETESFWVMRNDLRREKKLPGFFDKEVYDILAGGDGGAGGGGGGDFTEGLVLALAPSSAAGEAEVGVEPEAVFDSGRSAAADDGLFSDFEEAAGGGGISDKDFPVEKESGPASIPAPTPISEKQYQPYSHGRPAQGTSHENEPSSDPETGSPRGGRKRKRYDATDGDEETTNLQQQLIETLERNGKLLSFQLEAQNSHYQLEREQQKEHTNSLIAVLNKLADAMGRIADKL